MAELNTRWVSNKFAHVLGTQIDGIKKWGKVGLIAGAAIGLVAALVAPAAITIGGIALAGVVGAATWGACGAIMGGFLGGLKGMLTRPDPNVTQIMEDAGRCAPSQVPQHAPTHARSAMLMPGAGFAPAGAALPQQGAPAPQAQGGVAQNMSPQRLAEIRQLTDALGDLQGRIGDAAASTAPAAASVPQENWQSKVAAQQGPVPGAAERSR